MRILALALAYFCLAFGVFGLLVPLVPGTPFLLLSVFLFERNSPKVHNWIINNKFIGPPVLDWQKNKIIRPKAKFMASSLIFLSITYALVYRIEHNFIKILAASTGIVLILFISTRNSK